MVDQRLVKKGMREPRDGLVQQARVQIALARQYEDRLHLVGWTRADTETMRTCLGILDTEMAKQADERGLSRQATREEGERIDEAKTFIRRLRYALPRVLREEKVDGVSEESFATGGRLSRSTPKIVAYLTRIAPAVARLDAQLAPAFGGKAPSRLLLEVKSKLEAADTLQEMSVASLPQDTARVYEAKGRLLEMIEDLNRAGKSAFDGEAIIAALFNKDLVLRARNQKRATKEAEVIPMRGATTDGCRDEAEGDQAG